MPGGEKPDTRRSPDQHPADQHPADPQPAGETGQDRQPDRIRRQNDRIREMERLMKAAAAFARGRPPR